MANGRIVAGLVAASTAGVSVFAGSIIGAISAIGSTAGVAGEIDGDSTLGNSILGGSVFGSSLAASSLRFSMAGPLNWIVHQSVTTFGYQLVTNSGRHFRPPGRFQPPATSA